MGDNVSRDVSILSSQFAKEKDYWTNKLSGEITKSFFPRDSIHNSANDKFESTDFVLDKEVYSKIIKMSKGSDAKIFMMVTAAVILLLNKYTGNKDVIVGCPIFKQEREGNFINKILVLKNHISQQESFKEFLLKTRQSIVEASEHQNYPIEKLMYSLGIENLDEENGLFDTVILHKNIQDKKYIENIKANTVFTFENGDNELKVSLEYNAGCYTKESIGRILDHLNILLLKVLNNVDISIKDIEVFSEQEKTKMLVDFNNSDVYYPEDKLLHQLFEEQVVKTPQKVAITIGDNRINYSELNEKANMLSAVLRKKGIKRDSIVGILTFRSFEMIIGILAVLKAGGAYLPIDPKYPDDRIKYMLKDSNAKILLTTAKTKEEVPLLSFSDELNNLEEVLIIDEMLKELPSQYNKNPHVLNKPEDIAYVIYTSGTTGKPKGVMVEHKGIANTIIWRRDEYCLNSSDNVLQLFSYCFDGFLTSFFTPLVSGANSVFLDDIDSINPIAIKECILHDKITHFICVPALYSAILDVLTEDNAKSLRIVTLAGENITSNVIKKSKSLKRNLEIVNEYGPTECSVAATIKRDLREDCNITIGKPISNTRIFIVDKYLKLVPPGANGEICISGRGISRGYLNMPELTMERFVECPFRLNTDDNNSKYYGKMYRTGDMGRWNQDGNIEFVGRIDNQVKIRGYRIETGEIENAILKHPSVKEAVVMDREDEAGSKFLCTYVVFIEEASLAELKEFLASELPDYMIPSSFVKLDYIPLTPNGKIDRKELKKLDSNVNTGVEYVAPRDETEQRIEKIWTEILGAEKIGINDNFFDIGGHSLKATNLISKLHKEFNVEVLLSQVFSYPTIKGLADCIKKGEKNIYSAIMPVSKKEYYPVSSAQKRIYILSQFESANVTYNTPGVAIIEGELDLKILDSTFRKLIERHETLRTSFKMLKGELVQEVHENIDFELEIINMETENVEGKIQQTIDRFIRPFDLSKAPLIRAGVIKLSSAKYVLMCDMHHIISDGSSFSILLKEFSDIYEGKNLSPLKLQYKDFASWQNDLIKDGVIKKQEEYWIDLFKDMIPVLDLPLDYVRPFTKSFEGNSKVFLIDRNLTDKLNEIAQKTGTTLYMLLLAAYNVLLSKYSGQEDIVVGTPISGRPHADLLNIIGMFINTLPMRNFPSKNKTFRKFLYEVKENALKAYENQQYQFEDLVDKLDLDRDMSRNPLFDVVFTLQNMEMEDLEIDGLSIEPYNHNNKTSKFDISLGGSETEDGILFTVEYCCDLFKEETISRLINHYTCILQNISSDIDLMLCDIELMTPEDKNRILFELNNTDANYPKDKTIHRIFEEQVLKSQDDIAVVYENSSITYKELNEKSNCIARSLRQNGVKPGTIVGIMLERSIDMVVGILGVIKAGGAYLPIDPSYPRERIEYMLKDSGSEVLVTSSDMDHLLSTCIDIDNPQVYECDSSNLEDINRPDDLAYVIYTSGTTGTPKGVMIEHRNIVRLLFNDEFQFNFSKEDVWTMFHSFCFDFSVWEMYGALLYGGKLIVVPKLIAMNPKEYLKLLKYNKVTVLNQTPTGFYGLLKEELKEVSAKELELRYVIFGGEALKPLMLKEFKQKYPKTKLVNMYGITETTVHVTYKEITMDEIIKGFSNIGRPIPTLTTYVMDNELNLLPIGIKGELCVGGEGVARGYINNSLLTEQRFVKNPYKPDEKLYRSGDLVRLLENGDMEYLGRIDRQVKIRGFRIELGEIEHRLLSHDDVKEAVVIDGHDAKDNKYLAAYFVSSEKITLKMLREHLSKQLPQYMVPSYFVQVENIPLTSNGKINYALLPKPHSALSTGTDYVEPKNDIEYKVAEILSEILNVDRVGMNDDFFVLGGHSLKAISFIARVHKEFDVELPLNEIFKNPVVGNIADYINNADKISFTSITPCEKMDYYPVSSVQRRLLVLSRFQNVGTSYNMPISIMIEGMLDIDRFKCALDQLMRRHDTLRTSFVFIDGEPYQYIHDCLSPQIEYYESDEDNAQIIMDNFIKPFNLESAPLFRVGLIKINSKKHMLIFDMHHIISDGISTSILMSEFAKAYEGVSLSPLTLQYKDYSKWQYDLIKQGELSKQEEYWLSIFDDEIPVINLPYDYQRPSIKSFEGDTIDFVLDENLTKKLKEMAVENHSSLYMVLLSIYNVLLSKYSGQEDIVIGSIISGRHHVDLENIIGMFVNTLALRNKPHGSKTFKHLLDEVSKNTLNAFENQQYQYEDLIEKLNINRDFSRNPLFETVFILQNYDNFEENEIEMGDLTFTPLSYENKIAKFDLSITAVEMDKKILLRLEYCTKLFKRDTMERFIKHFANIADEVSIDQNKIISEVKMISKDEEKQLVFDFNNTESNYPHDKTIKDLFEERVGKNPISTAAVFEGRAVSYSELNKKSNQLARLLKEKGVVRESIVGLMVDRSIEMLIAILGVIKAGGAYLPIDRNYPNERINFMLDDSKASILITTSDMREIDGIPIDRLIYIDDSKINEMGDSNVDNINTPSDLAYVIYTSGSTGLPKGVMIEHKGICNLSVYFKEKLGLSREDRVLQFASISFDASVWEIFSSLLTGATLYIVPDDVIWNYVRFEEFLNINAITLATLPPTYITNINPENVVTIKKLVTAGSETNYEIVNKWKGRVQYINAYGPTENTICASVWHEGSTEDLYTTVPIGKPINNVKAFIVDKHNKLCPVGVIGELCLAGAGVARGYINRQDLTASKFVPCLFMSKDSEYSNNNGYKMYRTGDLAKWLPDGNIEFCGRIDDQVKIRGYRIELSEIEAKLLENEMIKDAVVTQYKNEKGEQGLLSYIIPKGELSIAKVRQYLLQKIPSYMVPDHFMFIEEIPVTQNKKVDYKELSRRGLYFENKKEYVAPLTDIEKQLANVWQDILGVEKIGVHDNFFELGGNSLKAIKVIGKLQGYYVSMRQILQCPTIAQLQRYIIPLNKEVEGLATVMKENLVMEYHFLDNGEIDSIAEKLDCFPQMLYFILKKKVKKEINYYDIFVQDISFCITLDEYGAINGVDILSFPVRNDIFKLKSNSGKGKNAIDRIEELLDEGEQVIVETHIERVPFNKNFQGIDSPFEEGLYSHTFLIVAHDDVSFYYVEMPGEINEMNHIQYAGNKSVGIIYKDDLVNAFNSFVKFSTVQINEKNLANESFSSKLINKCTLKNYYMKPKYNKSSKTIFGKDAVDYLYNLCKENKLFKGEESKANYIDYEEIAFKFNLIARRRQLLKGYFECSKVLENITKKKEVMKILESLFKHWSEVATIIREPYKLQTSSIYENLKSSIICACKLEKELIGILNRGK